MIAVRRAGPLDRDGLADLSTASVGEDDYVPAFLEGFLRTGVVLVAEDGDRMVGMMVYHDVPDGSAWLHAARTHPAHRRQGVATALMARCESLARRRRRTCLRLWASADNVASVTANVRYGFRERARFTRMRIASGKPQRATRLEPLDPVAAWARLEASAILRQGHGYVFHDFYFVPFDRTNARRLAREGALWRFGDNAISLSEGSEDAPGRCLQVQPLAGRAAAILRAAPGIGYERGADRVESFLPHVPALLEAARRAGFAFMDWGQEAVLFERRLPARRPGSGRAAR